MEYYRRQLIGAGSVVDGKRQWSRWHIVKSKSWTYCQYLGFSRYRQSPTERTEVRPTDNLCKVCFSQGR